MQTRRDRYFDFLYGEICVAMDRRISRYDFWLLVSETAANPSRLCHDDVERFIDKSLRLVLEKENTELAPRDERRLRQRLIGFDPRYPTPEEWLTALVRSAA